MELLLDTHSFLWFIMGSSRLSKKARDLMEDTNNEKLLSIASGPRVALHLIVVDVFSISCVKI